jgi:hypothetical protein
MKLLESFITQCLLLEETEASKKAHALGLIYAGYQKWKDQKGDTVAKSVNGGKDLVKIDTDNEPYGEPEKSPVTTQGSQGNSPTSKQWPSAPGAIGTPPQTSLKPTQTAPIGLAKTQSFDVSKALDAMVVNPSAYHSNDYRAILGYVTKAADAKEYYQLTYIGQTLMKKGLITKPQWKKFLNYAKPAMKISSPYPEKPKLDPSTSIMGKLPNYTGTMHGNVGKGGYAIGGIPVDTFDNYSHNVQNALLYMTKHVVNGCGLEYETLPDGIKRDLFKSMIQAANGQSNQEKQISTRDYIESKTGKGKQFEDYLNILIQGGKKSKGISSVIKQVDPETLIQKQPSYITHTGEPKTYQHTNPNAPTEYNGFADPDDLLNFESEGTQTIFITSEEHTDTWTAPIDTQRATEVPVFSKEQAILQQQWRIKSWKSEFFKNVAHQQSRWQGGTTGWKHPEINKAFTQAINGPPEARTKVMGFVERGMHINNKDIKDFVSAFQPGKLVYIGPSGFTEREEIARTFSSNMSPYHTSLKLRILPQADSTLHALRLHHFKGNHESVPDAYKTPISAGYDTEGELVCGTAKNLRVAGVKRFVKPTGQTGYGALAYRYEITLQEEKEGVTESAMLGGLPAIYFQGMKKEQIKQMLKYMNTSLHKGMKTQGTTQ